MLVHQATHLAAGLLLPGVWSRLRPERFEIEPQAPGHLREAVLERHLPGVSSFAVARVTDGRSKLRSINPPIASTGLSVPSRLAQVSSDVRNVGGAWNCHGFLPSIAPRVTEPGAAGIAPRPIRSSVLRTDVGAIVPPIGIIGSVGCCCRSTGSVYFSAIVSAVPVTASQRSTLNTSSGSRSRGSAAVTPTRAEAIGRPARA